MIKVTATETAKAPHAATFISLLDINL